MKKTYEHEYQYEFMDINQYYYIKFNHQFPLIYKISNKDIYKYDKFFYNLTFNNVKNIYQSSTVRPLPSGRGCKVCCR